MDDGLQDGVGMEIVLMSPVNSIKRPRWDGLPMGRKPIRS